MCFLPILIFGLRAQYFNFLKLILWKEGGNKKTKQENSPMREECGRMKKDLDRLG